MCQTAPESLFEDVPDKDVYTAKRLAMNRAKWKENGPYRRWQPHLGDNAEYNTLRVFANITFEKLNPGSDRDTSTYLPRQHHLQQRQPHTHHTIPVISAPHYSTLRDGSRCRCTPLAKSHRAIYNRQSHLLQKVPTSE